MWNYFLLWPLSQSQWDAHKEGESMDEYYTTVRLSDKGADVRLGHLNFMVFRRDGIEVVHGCPIAYVAGALGS
jgi:hypothetical protein